MRIDAVLLLRPKKPAMLRGVIDPYRHHVVLVDEGALLIHTFVRFRAVERDRANARQILASYGPALADAQDDPRGILFFPDVCEPRGQSYDEVGVWVKMVAAAELRDVEALSRDEEYDDLAAEVASELRDVEAPSRDEEYDDLAAGSQPSSGTSRCRAARKSTTTSLPGRVRAPGRRGRSARCRVASELRDVEAAARARHDARGASDLLSEHHHPQRPSRRPIEMSHAGLCLNSCQSLADGAPLIHVTRRR